MERRKRSRHSITLPLEYWETDDSSLGGLVSDLSEAGLLMYSVKDIHFHIKNGVVVRVRWELYVD